MVDRIRLMPNHDPDWRRKVASLQAQCQSLLGREGMLSTAEQQQLSHLRQAMMRALNSRFRTTAEYRDFHFQNARQLLDDEGIDLSLPPVPDDARLEEIDSVLSMVNQVIDITTGG